MHSIDERLKKFSDLPDTAVVSIAVAAMHDDVSPKTVRRRYPLVQLSPRRHGVSVGYLRHRGKTVAA